MNRQDYYDLGADTERWWRDHVKAIMPTLRHTPRCRGYDFRGDFEGATVYIDVKFCRSEYRQKGWLEAKTWGKTTGIIQTALDNYKNANVDVYIVILHCGKFHMLDAKKILASYERGELPLLTGTSTDDNEEKTTNRFWQLNGFDDPRFQVIEGPMKLEHWKPSTEIGKRIDIKNWMKGVWNELD
jgi:hypothetical protein